MANDAKNCKLKLSGGLAYEAEISLAVAHQILGLIISGGVPSPQANALITSPNVAKGSGTAKSFVASKRPTTDVEKVACLAYFLTHSESIIRFKSADLERASTEAALDISNLPRATDNATRQSKFLAKAGEGTKQITSLGEAVVNAMPDRAAVAAALDELPSRRRKRTSKKKL